jgi:hypothetical protein
MKGTQEEIRYWTRDQCTRNRMTKSKQRLGVEVDLLPSLLLPLLGIRVHAIDLDDRGALCQVGSDDDLQEVSEK